MLWRSWKNWKKILSIAFESQKLVKFQVEICDLAAMNIEEKLYENENCVIIEGLKEIRGLEIKYFQGLETFIRKYWMQKKRLKKVFNNR